MKHISKPSSILAALLLLVAFAGVTIWSTGPDKTSAASGSISGWVWSETIGWISLNCSNLGVCGTSNYGLTLNADETITGYAWSENIGWIKFGGLSGFPSGLGTQAVNAQRSGNSMIGWARACAGTLNGNCS
ncbi:MAG: Carbohydrate-binding CenC protein, partial [Parcubacteria group bacterium Gr01-1014_56]